MEEELNIDILKHTKILDTYTLRKLKKAIIKMKANKLAITKMRRHQMVNLILTFLMLFPDILNNTGTKRQPKPPKKEVIPPASIKLTRDLLRKLKNATNAFNNES